MSENGIKSIYTYCWNKWIYALKNKQKKCDAYLTPDDLNLDEA